MVIPHFSNNRIKILIDNNYVDYNPFRYVIAGILYKNKHLNRLNRYNMRFTWPAKWLNKKAFNESAFDGIELNITFSSIIDRRWNIIPKNIEKIKKWPVYMFHACYQFPPSCFNHLHLNMAEDRPYVAKAIKANLAVCAGISPEKSSIVFHPGCYDLKKGVKSRKLAVINVIKNLGSVIDYAKENNITILLENSFNTKDHANIGSDYQDLAEILDYFKEKNIKAAFDWGHANVHASGDVVKSVQKSGRDDYLKNFTYHKEFADSLGREIVHLHVHYNTSHKMIDGQKKRYDRFAEYDEHLPLTRIDEDDFENFSSSIAYILNKTNVSECITLELPQKKCFGFYPILKNGSNLSEQIGSAMMLRKIIAKSR